VKDKSVLNRVVNVCGKVVGEKQVRLCELYESRVVRKGREIAKDTSHVLAQYYELLSSGRRYRVPKACTVRTKNSFISKSIGVLNKR